MKRFLIPIALSLALSGCLSAGTAVNSAATVADAVGAPPPVTIADKTVLDEQAGLAITSGYRAAVTAARLANRVRPFSPALKAKVADLDNRAFAAVAGVRTAYETGNADSYREAAARARSLIDQIVALVGDPK